MSLSKDKPSRPDAYRGATAAPPNTSPAANDNASRTDASLSRPSSVARGGLTRGASASNRRLLATAAHCSARCGAWRAHHLDTEAAATSPAPGSSTPSPISFRHSARTPRATATASTVSPSSQSKKDAAKSAKRSTASSAHVADAPVAGSQSGPRTPRPARTTWSRRAERPPLVATPANVASACKSTDGFGPRATSKKLGAPRARASNAPLWSLSRSASKAVCDSAPSTARAEKRVLTASTSASLSGPGSIDDAGGLLSVSPIFGPLDACVERRSAAASSSLDLSGFSVADRTRASCLKA
mmetsp:Transcript_8809/g.26353  ORF Transcript_8809/g.26353 Transcript_8809/m.26353 type:complete len:300 (-) Transcript_8809:119-1018(-)